MKIKNPADRRIFYFHFDFVNFNCISLFIMSLHAFSPDSACQLSPIEWYEGASLKEGFIHDPAQREAITYLQALYDELLAFQKKRNRFLGRSLRQPSVPKGLYFWGGVGRGKSFLMDVFYACVPFKRKRRVHFHHFMMEVHQGLAKLTREVDPLLAIATEIAKKTRLLCFDEFHVSDIADAMILSRLLGALLDKGVVLVVTSNYPPADLYPNGLKRDNFLPAIDLLERTLTVVNVDGGNDYRLRALTKEPLYLIPLNKENQQKLLTIYRNVATSKELKHELTIMGRSISAVHHSMGVVWFDFLEICGGPRSQTDYVEIAKEYHTVIVSGIPQLSAEQSSEARRFTWLVDVFYDSRVKLIISAEVKASLIYLDGIQASEFFRTASRLTEMQTREYLSLPHLF